MLGRLGILVAVFAVALAPASAKATQQDMAATHTYLTAGYTTLRAAIASMSTVGRSIDQLNRKLASECPDVGAGSPQSEEEQHLSYEVFGALLSTGYHTDAKIVQRFLRTTRSLKWSNNKATRAADSFAASLHELVTLPLPNLCGDVSAWKAGGFKAVPADTIQFDRHVESIEGDLLPLKRLLAPYETQADKALATRDERMYIHLGNLETTLGENWWDMTLETLALNQ
jgi:hypothetical protein